MADTVASATSQAMGAFPTQWRRTMTFGQRDGVRPSSPAPVSGHRCSHLRNPFTWCNGGRENAIGHMRRVLPARLGLADINDQSLDRLVQYYTILLANFWATAPRRGAAQEFYGWRCTTVVNPLSCWCRDVPRDQYGHLMHHRTQAAGFGLPDHTRRSASQFLAGSRFDALLCPRRCLSDVHMTGSG